MFGAFGDLKKAMQMAGQMKTVMADMKEKAGTIKVTGEAGAGMVRVEMNGRMEVLNVVVDPGLTGADGDHEMLQDLVAAAVNSAIAKAKEEVKNVMQQEMGGMLPPGMDIPGL